MNNTKFEKLALVYREQPLQIECFLRRGQKEAVLYLHGLGCSKNDFLEATDIYELQPHTLIGFDFPGCGDSPYPKDITFGIDDLVEVTNIVVSKLNLGDFVVVGHSMGGLVALLYAEKYGEHVKGFINVEGNLAPEDCFLSRRVTRYGSNGFTKEVLKNFQQELAQSDNKGFQEFAKTLQSASEKALVDYSSSLVDYSDNANLIHRFTELKIPKLFLYGAENRGLSYIPRLKDSECEVVEIPNSGHFPFSDNPQAYYQAISDFLGSVFSERFVDST